MSPFIANNCRCRCFQSAPAPPRSERRSRIQMLLIKPIPLDGWLPDDVYVVVVERHYQGRS